MTTTYEQMLKQHGLFHVRISGQALYALDVHRKARIELTRGLGKIMVQQPLKPLPQVSFKKPNPLMALFYRITNKEPKEQRVWRELQQQHQQQHQQQQAYRSSIRGMIAQGAFSQLEWSLADNKQPCDELRVSLANHLRDSRDYQQWKSFRTTYFAHRELDQTLMYREQFTKHREPFTEVMKEIDGIDIDGFRQQAQQRAQQQAQQRELDKQNTHPKDSRIFARLLGWQRSDNTKINWKFWQIFTKPQPAAKVGMDNIVSVNESSLISGR